MPDRLAPTPLCDLLGCRLPIVCAGMGGVARSELVAAVTRAGGFGFLAMVREPLALIEREVAAVRAAGCERFGVHLIPAGTDAALLASQLDLCVDLQVPVVGLLGDVHAPVVERLRGAGATVVHQVGSVRAALAAQRAGAHALIAQGVEAGGHGHGRQPLAELLAEVLALAELPVAAAGGLADGQDVARVLAAGAQAAVLGTAFLAPLESFAHGQHEQHEQRVGATGAGALVRQLAQDAAAHLALLKPPLVEYASPVCYAPEFERQRDAQLADRLNALLEAERAAAWVALEAAQALAPDGPARASLEALHDDAARWCGVLLRALQSLDAWPSPRTGGLYEQAAAATGLHERLALLREHQSEVVQALDALLQTLEREELRADLQAMREARQDRLAHLGDSPGHAAAAG